MIRPTEVEAECAHEAQNTMLGCLVDEETGCFFEACHGGDEEDRPVCVGVCRPILSEVNSCDAGNIKTSEEVDIQNFCRWRLSIVNVTRRKRHSQSYLTNSLHVKRRIEGVSDLDDTRSRNGVVDSAVCVHGFVEEVQHRAVSGDVCLDEYGSRW